MSVTPLPGGSPSAARPRRSDVVGRVGIGAPAHARRRATAGSVWPSGRPSRALGRSAVDHETRRRRPPMRGGVPQRRARARGRRRRPPCCAALAAGLAAGPGRPAQTAARPALPEQPTTLVVLVAVGLHDVLPHAMGNGHPGFFGWVDARRHHVAGHGLDPVGSRLPVQLEPASPRSCRCRRRAPRARPAAALSGRCRSQTRALRRRRRAPRAGRRPARRPPDRTCSPSARRTPPRCARRSTPHQTPPGTPGQLSPRRSVSGSGAGANGPDEEQASPRHRRYPREDPIVVARARGACRRTRLAARWPASRGLGRRRRSPLRPAAGCASAAGPRPPRRARRASRRRFAPSCPPPYDRDAAVGAFRRIRVRADAGPFRALKTWATIAARGRAGIAAQVARANGLARELSTLVEREPQLELAAAPETSIVAFRARPAGRPPARLDEVNRALPEAIQARGRTFVTGTVSTAARRCAPASCTPTQTRSTSPPSSPKSSRWPVHWSPPNSGRPLSNATRTPPITL